VDVIGAEAHAVFAQYRPFRLFQPLHFVGNTLPVENAERLDQLEGDTAGNAAHVGRRPQREQWTEQLFDVRLHPAIEPRFHRVPRRAGQMLVGDEADARAQDFLAGDQLADGGAGPGTVPSVASTNCSAGASARRAARALISPASAFCAAFCNALASDPPDEASGTKTKPSSRPMPCPSTTTSPVLLISGSSIAFSRRRRISLLVRRSTKRSVRRSCKASESL